MGEGPVLWVPEATGKPLMLRADTAEGALHERPQGMLRVGLVEEVAHGWSDERLDAFGPATLGRVRVVSYNILAQAYARTQTATRDMYPYCPASVLDYSYRQPLLGRELKRLDGDVVFLQECSFYTYRKFLLPLFGDRYHIRCSLKASHVSEGCIAMAKTEAFEVLEEKDCHFRKVLRTGMAFRAILREVAAKWPDFITTVLPRMTTVFQLLVVRHKASDTIMVLANTHLFFHPLARHIRLLQLLCLLQEVQELRERYKGAEGRLPDVILGGDLNCLPDTGAIELLLKGSIGSTHPDWEHCKQFAWRDEEELAGDNEDDAEGERVSNGSRPSLEADMDDEIVPLLQEDWSPGLGVDLRSAVGALNDTYSQDPLPFTNYVNEFVGTLDYICVTQGLKPVKTLRAPTEEDLMPYGGLPCALHPSDHLSIAVDLELSPSSAG